MAVRQNVYSVKQVNSYIKHMFEQDFMLNRIYVKGEVSNCKYHSSGHIYFSLKDDSGTIACILFAGNRNGLGFRMQDGQQVIVLGNVTTYERDGKYQLYAREIHLDGAGLLYERFEALKKELEEMGMFAPEYKQPLPRFAKKVGIVTASTGAAIRDIIQIATRRNPYVQLVLYPAQVQGAGAAESIVKGIQMLDREDVDVLIVGRGGGSMEDLWAFNEEIVARAIFNCNTPVISAVGHETDTTIADYVADQRAPTPSAAAELAVYEYRMVQEAMEEQKRRLNRYMTNELLRVREQSERYRLRLEHKHPRRKLQAQQQRAADGEEALRRKMELALLKARQEYALRVERMKGVSPVERLDRGFSYVTDQKGQNVRSVLQVQKGDRLSVHMKDGVVQAITECATKEED